MIRYVLGFMFDPKKFGVLLIQKQKPKWQAGLLNGIGGKIEEGENDLGAMIREFKEETGVYYSGWEKVITMKGEDWEVVVYSAFDYLIHEAKQMEKEAVAYYPLEDLHKYDVVSNLDWLIPMCLDVDQNFVSRIDYKLNR